MLKFEKIKYKNLLSSGNYWTEINFLKSDATLVIGKNGAGKSTILDALTFVLFNKPFRKINKSQLINTSNEKDCLVEIEFSIQNDSYKVIRGIKPNVFKIIKNNKIIDELASSNDQQKWLEQNVLKLNYKSFTQIVILGSSSFVPFMQLSSQHRREVVEDILDIRVFSTMNEITKSNIKGLRDDIRELEYKKENVKDKIENQNILIKQLSKRNDDDIKQKTDRSNVILAEVKSLTKTNNELISKCEIENDKIREFCNASTKLRKLEDLKIKISQKINNISTDEAFFKDNSVCPTCTQSIDEKFRLNKIAEISNKMNELNSAIENLEISIQEEKENEANFLEVSKTINKFNNEINFNNIKISELEKQYRNIQQEIQKLASRNEDINSEYEKLNTYKESFNDILLEISNKKEELLNYEFLHLLLKDGGAKTSIIKKYLPVINKNLNKYLDLMEFSINFTLDEEFNEHALNPIFEDFSYDSFSEGEKMRIDLALLFTWREIAKIKNSVNTNLLILDEVFDSSLDEFGTDNFTKIIRYVIKKSNVFVISHKTDELLDKFDSVLTFEKRKGFGYLVDV